MTHRTIKHLRALVAGCVAALLLGSVAARVEIPTLQVAEHPDYGSHIVDEAGISLYLFNQDKDGISSCEGECSEAWPPLLIAGQVAFSKGVDLGLFGTTERADGIQQLTYGGWPLYRFAQDQQAGDALGQSQNDTWFLINPSGNAVEKSDQQTSTGEVNDFDRLLEDGAAVYTSHCSQCHGRNGDQTRGGASLLAGNRELSNGPRVARQVLFGGPYMPSFGGTLSNFEVAAVTTFVRNSWGHEFGVFTEQEVIDERAKFE